MPADVPVTILSDGPSLLKASVSLEMPLNAGAAGDCITSAAPQHCSAANTLEVVDTLYIMAVLSNKCSLLPCCKQLESPEGNDLNSVVLSESAFMPFQQFLIVCNGTEQLFCCPTPSIICAS